MSDGHSASLSWGARKYAMVILAIVYMFNFVDRQILAILLPQIRDEFGISDAYLGFLSGTAFAIFYVILGIPIAQYADRCNRRNLIAAAVALWSAMTALSGLAVNIWQLTAARIGVGIGEAGCSPPAHSMIADYFPPDKRSTAMGFYTLGISAGIMTAYLAGGWVAQNVGWRAAFFVVGIPGLLLAAIVRFTLTEPRRGASENREASGRKSNVKEVFSFLVSRRSFIHMAVAAGLSSFVGYSIISFMPSFMVRSFDMEIAVLGRWLGLILGIAGGAGYFFGGYLADQFGRHSHRKALNFIAITVLVTTALLATMFLAKTSTMALLLFILPAATMNVYLAPVLSQAQSLVALQMRATTSALILLIINVIGLGVGPLVTGVLSDALEPQFGEESMRYSLLIVTSVILPWAIWHYYCAGKWIDADLARAAEKD
jgi:predicted MFS family arabinose efflux permease|tara:strand:- start:243 stop:1532 length:1290 start_codon:yes stop_codon:yes gene_type:complete